MFLWDEWMVLFRVRMLPCTFHQKRWWYIWFTTHLVSFKLCCCFKMQCILFLPSCQVPMYIYVSHKWTGFCFCCFFVSFLWWSQTVDVIVECYPCENSKCLYFLQGNLSTYEIHGKSNHDSWYTIVDFFVWSMSLSVENFFVWHSWAGGLKMSWPR